MDTPAVDQTQDSAPLSPTPMNAAFKIVIVLLVISLLAVSLIFAYFFSQRKSWKVPEETMAPVASPMVDAATPTPDTEWKTYQMNGEPMSFRFPSSYVVSGVDVWTTVSPSDAGPVLRYRYLGKSKLTVDQYMATYRAPNSDVTLPPQKFTNTVAVSMNGLSGYKAESSGSVYYFLKSPTAPGFVEFNYVLDPSEQGKMFEQIITTVTLAEKAK